MTFDREIFFDGYRRDFGRIGQNQVGPLEFLLESFEGDSVWADLRHIAYALATIKHETADTFQPITEYGGRKYFDKYDVGRLARQLGNTPEKDGDGFLYRGRGYVQLTGRKNYRDYGIEKTPDRALEPRLAFKIMSVGMFRGTYTTKKLTDYIAGNRCDYLNARRIINGLDKAARIAAYAEDFETILRDALIPDVPAIDRDEIDLFDDNPGSTAANGDPAGSIDVDPQEPTSNTVEFPEPGAGSGSGAVAGDGNGQLSDFGLQLSGGNEPIGDPPDAEPSFFMKVTDWKPWATRWASRIWKGVTGVTLPAGGGLGFAALQDSANWYVYAIVGAIILFLIVAFGVLATLVVAGIYMYQNRGIAPLKAEQLRSFADPNRKNVGLIFEPK